MDEIIPKEKSPNPIWFRLFGAYLVLGAIYTLTTASWFPGFPVQLDMSLLFGSVIGIYVEAFLAAFLGIVCFWLSAKKVKHEA
jgi:uncharacterized membrane protein YdjX (TVP38/TMEM64 family)